MLTFLMVVVALRLILSVAKYAWSILLRIAHPDWARVKQDFSLEPTVSILLPCYNEGPDVYHCIRTILECDYPAPKFEVIATDDRSRDDSFEWIQKAAADFRTCGRATQSSQHGKVPHADWGVSRVHIRHYSCDRFRLYLRERHNPTASIVLHLPEDGNCWRESWHPQS
jgi:cellulose synthase/poly-beta-1,6-N-acetylglucosamine synthase-like glycosyltransferase